MLFTGTVAIFPYVPVYTGEHLLETRLFTLVKQSSIKQTKKERVFKLRVFLCIRRKTELCVSND